MSSNIPMLHPGECCLFFFYTLCVCTRFPLKKGICCKNQIQFLNCLTKCPLSYGVQLQRLWFSSHQVIHLPKPLANICLEWLRDLIFNESLGQLIRNRPCKEERKTSLHMLLMSSYKHFTLISFHSKCLEGS